MPERKRRKGPDRRNADGRGKEGRRPAANAVRGAVDPEGGTVSASEVVAPDKARRESRTIEIWPLTRLRKHPNQDALCHDLTGREFEQLVASVRAEGLNQPVEALPDGTLLDGHQRARAARRLGWEEIDVWVRRDLAANPVAADRRHAEANLVRRQLDPLDTARAAKALMEVERRRPFADSEGRRARFEWEEGDLRDRVGKIVGRSGRHVQRLLNVLGLPMAIQRAVSEKRLSIVLADRVAGLPETDRSEIAGEIAAGGDPAAAVSSRLPATAPSDVDPDKEYDRFLKSARHAVASLEGVEGRVRGGTDLDTEIEALRSAGSLIDRLISRHKSLKRERARILRDFKTRGGPNGRS